MSTATITPYRFGGQVGYRRDSPSRQYVRARHLDTAKGRWASRDPIGFDGGADLYVFTGNNPALYHDASGLYPCHSTRGRDCNVPGYHPGGQDHGFTCPSLVDLFRIGCYCKFDKNPSGPTPTCLLRDPAFGPLGPTQAITHCYLGCDCQNYGCTLVDNRFAKMPSIYQHCIALHEQRRRQGCYKSGSTFPGYNDTSKIRSCVYEALRKCHMLGHPAISSCLPS